MIDFAIAHLRDVRMRPVWQPMPDPIRAGFKTGLPEAPQPLDAVFEEMQARVFPWAMGNNHPRFWGWYMGAGCFTGALADFLAAIDGSNLGSGDTAASKVDEQVTDWLRQILGFPQGASGTLVNGGSMANLIGLTAARNAMAGTDLRKNGVADMPVPLRFYASDQVHACHLKAMNLLGLGSRAIRLAGTDMAYRMDVDALQAAIAADRAKGAKPACVIATAGTTNTGAIDPLPAIADLCRDEGLWLHIDGCVGALFAIAPENRDLVTGIERADSLALDLHKGLHAPFDVGCALLRDARLHRATFDESAEYLQLASRGIAAAEHLHRYSPETTRSFRALKLWMMIKHHGVETFGRILDRNIAQARHLTRLIVAEHELALLAPTASTIVCFRHDPGGMDEAALRAHNTEVMLRLQESGLAVLTDTTIRGQHCLRVAICNHRTRSEDLDLLVGEVLRIGKEITSTAADI
ncbi:MAG: aminotransferase class V-fold PLP-dependent enzyme [Pararhodobacter sp.]|nr:aminotransferase class V-fold PLP-dependent enzyme [Pararhodobacter sp.]